MTLPALLPVSDIHDRLKAIFPEGTPNRKHSVWEIAAKTIFTMLYIGAVEERGVWLRPNQVARMTDAQAGEQADEARVAWHKVSMSNAKKLIPGRWYADTTRESIRDDTIRYAFLANGVIIERTDIATTSPQGRYALKASFAALFDPALTGEQLLRSITSWQENNLSRGALARVAIHRKGAAVSGERTLVTFPNGETRLMAVGSSAVISKAVVEVFAKEFLQKPVLIFLSESKNKVVSRDDDLAKGIGLHIIAEKNLPDIILADLEPKHPLIVFVEVVATDGPVSQQRQEALLKLTEQAGFPAEHVTFVTAYFDRTDPAFKRTVDSVAWGTFVWFVSEPKNLLHLYEGKPQSVRWLHGWQ